jgi:hypothetical protein
MSFGKPASITEECEGKYFIVRPGAVYVTPVYAGATVYPDRPTAIKAAYALAAQYPDKQFCVCKVVGVAKTSKPPVSYTDYDTKKKVK